MLVQRWAQAQILRNLQTKSGPRSESRCGIWVAVGVVWGDILGSKTNLFGNMFETTRKTCGFRKMARRAGERLVLEVRGGILGALGDLQTI